MSSKIVGEILTLLIAYGLVWFSLNGLFGSRVAWFGIAGLLGLIMLWNSDKGN